MVARIETMKALAGASIEVKADIYQSGQKHHSVIQVVKAGEPAYFVESTPAPYSIVATPRMLDKGQILVDVKTMWQLIKGVNTAQPYQEFNSGYATLIGPSGKAARPVDFKVNDVLVSLVITATQVK
jgi:hypothetical protein